MPKACAPGHHDRKRTRVACDYTNSDGTTHRITIDACSCGMWRHAFLYFGGEARGPFSAFRPASTNPLLSKPKAA